MEPWSPLRVGMEFAHLCVAKSRTWTRLKDNIHARPACLRSPSLETQLLVRSSKNVAVVRTVQILLKLTCHQDLGIGEWSFGLLAVMKGRHALTFGVTFIELLQASYHFIIL